jgi:hypothetical protein
LLAFFRLPLDNQAPRRIPSRCATFLNVAIDSAEKTMPVPTEEEWGDYQADVDQKYAHDLFAGHTNEEMQPHFYRNVIERTDELRWMPEVPFRYYMLGFRDFVLAGKFSDLWNSDAASCFLGLVEEKLKSHPGCILPIMPELPPAIRHVGQNQTSFDADEEVYGKFKEKLDQIEALYSRCRNGS